MRAVEFRYNDQGIRCCFYCSNVITSGTKSIDYGAEVICEDCVREIAALARKHGMMEGAAEPPYEPEKYLICKVEGCDARFNNHGEYLSHMRAHKKEKEAAL